MFGRMPKRQKVRIHLEPQPHVETTPSIDGFLVGVRFGHYIVEKPEVIKAASQTVELASRTVNIPASQVWFYEVLA